jgi:hypothetical protein
MPHQHFPDGLYLLKQASEKNGIAIDHYGVADVGNVLGHPESNGSHPLVIHQTPPRIQIDWLKDTGQWQVVGKVMDIEGAKARLRVAFRYPAYNLFGNNCEHFAKFVAQNNHSSSQVFFGVAGTIVAGMALHQSFKNLKD